MSMKLPLCTNDGFVMGKKNRFSTYERDVMGKKSRFCTHDRNNMHRKWHFSIHDPINMHKNEWFSMQVFSSSAPMKSALPPGYKQTEVGVIPEDWEVKRLGEVVEKFVGGGTPSRSIPHYWGNDIPWVTVKDFATFNPRQSQESITKTGLQNSASHLVPKGTLITSTRMALGKAVVYEVDVAINQDLKALSPKPVLKTQFLYYWFQSNGKFIDEMGGGSTVKGISLPDLKKIDFILPPKAEQEAIAEALSDTDALIESLEQLITKKRHLKQGAMQELLTGKKRLPGFSGEWEVKRLDGVCFMKSGEGITSDNIDEGSEFPCFGGNGLRGYAKSYTHDGNYALIGRQGALCGNVLGVSGKFFASEHAIVVTPFQQTDIIWLTFTLGKMNLNQYSESSAQPGLSVSKLLELSVYCPPVKAEQTTIAAILSDMDAEIATLETKLGKTRQLKQGMMHNLLTGRIRLI